MNKLLAAVTLGAAAMLAGGALAAGASEPIVIGQISELTGPYTSLGVDTQLGAEQAVAEINAAGGLLGGRQIKLVVKDDKTQPAQAVIAFNQLAGEGMSALVGPVFSNSALAIIEPVGKAKVPMVSTAAADEQVKPVAPYVFIDSPLSSVVAEQLLRYFQAKNIAKIAIAYASDQSFGKDGVKAMTELAQKYGVSVVATLPFDTGTTNFASILTQVRGSGAQTLMVWGSGAAPVILTKQFAAAEMKMPLVMSHAQASTLYTKPAGAAASGVIMAASAGVAGRSLPDSKLKTLVSQMAATFEKNHQRYPSQFAFAGYSAVKLIAAAMTKANSSEPAAVQAALNNLTALVPLGEYRYTPTDHAGLAIDYIVIARVGSEGEIAATAWSTQQLGKFLK